ncbi:MAG: flagellar motor protein MotB [Polyangiales bacterium]
MARRKRQREEPHVSHERWLVSYADFITLLFAFFVVLFAISQVDDRKMGRLAEAVQEATKVGIFDEKDGRSPILGGAGEGVPAKESLIDPATSGLPSGMPIETIRQRLATNLASALAGGRVMLVERGDGLVVRLRDAAFFEPAKAVLRREVLPDLYQVGQTLRDLTNEVRIEGHTDTLPIRTSMYRSNWELSAARGAAVLDELVRHSGIHESRLSIGGYGSQRPIASNDVAEGRSQNRRVDIVVLNHSRGASLDAAKAEKEKSDADEAVADKPDAGP